MRHLGFICIETKLKHIKEACLIEIIARSAKNIIRHQMSSFI